MFKPILTVLVSTILVLVFLETCVRLMLDDGMQYDLEMWKYARQMKRVSSVAEAGHEHIPGVTARLMGVDVQINSTGQRNPEVSMPKPDDTFRILMLGDSLTFGWGVPEYKTLSRRLERTLSKALRGDRRVSVVNAGVGNYNAKMQTAWLLAEGDKYEPDMVILNYFINDAEITPVRQGGVFREYSAAFVYFWGRIDILQRRYLGKPDWRQYYRSLYAKKAEGWRDTERAFAKLSEYANRRAIPLLVVNYPEIRELSPYPFGGVSAQIANLANKHRLPYLDLLASVVDQRPETLWVSPEDAHPNGKAFKLFSDAISDWMMDFVLN
ncbi:MAG: SGNH/GDSL hydrolase family protein [Pseudomonadota bacterium]|nr:SGNH/GDSL hydrolase family protein [Pseudomonadota bacterium]